MATHEPLTIQKIQKVENYAVSYTDGNGTSDTAFISMFPNGEMVFTLPDNGHKKVSQPAGWLKKLILGKLGKDLKENPEVPEEKVDPAALMGDQAEAAGA